jgi:HK97 family phage portal protein
MGTRLMPASKSSWNDVLARARTPGSAVLKYHAAAKQAKSAGVYPSLTTFSPTDQATIERLFGRSTYTGRAVTDDYAMAVSTVWRCVQLISQTVGSLPWAVFERLGPESAREVDDHWLADILVHSPNADMDRLQFREAKTANLAFRGNTYSLKEFRNDGTVSSLYPMPSKEVTPKRDRETGEMRYVFSDRGKPVEYPREKVFHVRLFGFDGLVGLSPLGNSRHAIALAAAAEEFGSRFFANGARISGTVTIPDWLEDEQREKAKKNLEENWSGLENAHRLRLLEGGMKYEQASATPGEAQHNELRLFQIRDICRFFGVPPHLVFDLEHGSYNNVETLASEWVMFGLLPYLVRFELAAVKQLLRPAERRKFFVRFNFEGLLRANSQERAQFYNIMLQNGVFTRNQVRQKENLNRADAPGMDDYTVQSNMALIQFLEAMVKAGAASGRGDGAGAPPKAGDLSIQMPELNLSQSFNLPDSVRLDVKDATADSVERLARALTTLGGRQDEIAALVKRLGEIQASELELRRKQSGAVRTATIKDRAGNVVETITLGAD